MTSTSFITGTGLKKCMPITLSGRLVRAAIFVIEIDEVFEARMTSGFRMRSRSRKISDLISNFSVAASTTRSQAAELCAIEHGGDATESCGLVGRGNFIFRDFAIEVFADCL